MLKVRLQRVGRKNDPSFRVIVTDSTRGPKSGKYIEMLGSYNPRQKRVALNGDRIKYWMSVGAKATGTMHNILIKEKIIEGKKINVLPKKTPIKKETAKEKETEGSQKSENEVKEESSTISAETELSTPSDGAVVEDEGVGTPTNSVGAEEDSPSTISDGPETEEGKGKEEKAEVHSGEGGDTEKSASSEEKEKVIASEPKPESDSDGEREEKKRQLNK